MVASVCSLPSGACDAVFARIASTGSGKKSVILCGSLFYSQPHVISKRAVIGQFRPSHMSPQREFQ